MPHGRPRPADAPDHELTARIRSGADQEAAAVLYERHGPSVLAYARGCCRSAHTAEDLASEAFARTLEAVRAGHGPHAAWRPYLLTVVRRTAAEWAASERRTVLSEDFERWCDGPSGAADAASAEDRALRDEDRRLVLHGFRSLPERWQAVLWYAEVDREPAGTVARLLGLSRSGVASLTARAREGLREAYLAAHLRRTGGDEECRRYGSLLAAAARRPEARAKRALAAHLDTCPACRRAMAELTDLNERIGAVLPVAVLLWGGERLVSGAAATAAAGGAGTAGGGAAVPAVPVPDPTAVGSWPVKALPWGAGAAAAAVAALWLAAAPWGGPDSDGPGVAAPTAAPSAAAPPSDRVPRAVPPPASPGPTGSTPAAAPAPGGTATEPPVRAAAEPVSAPHDRTRLRIAATGRCVEIPDAEPAYGVQAREATCDGSAGQQWDVLMPYEGDRGRLQVRNTATGLCLRNSGTTKDREPVVQHRCDAGDRRQLWWLYTEDGTVGSLWDQDVVMILGLADWYEGEKGLPHSPRLATNHNYYNSSSFRLLFDGVLFDGRMAEAAERPS